ncbi:hypothetical protein MmiEs2_09030 [Methanimicrococcus stummii]|uniref:Uncharacterized protein n=1 Tax=Methanimicrococcus stummii TaxID=3028294 RepID=A0AA96ZX73_9EURY|nr:hypothetical protein [Methanimicrococcus sp. Es2]WNY28700.1 hypothetical protein MmiEs2_09030 [Methanimicrococcus sp. Es2]
MNKTQKKIAKELNEYRKIQKDNIWDDYSVGLYNGIEFCCSVVENRDAKFKRWNKKKQKAVKA